MKFLFWLLGLSALAVALALSAGNAGYVLLVYPPYRIDMSLTLFVMCLRGVVVAVYFLLRIALATMKLTSYVLEFGSKRSQNKARFAMTAAIEAFFEGRYVMAEKEAVRAMELGEHSAINPVIAARAAHELGEFVRRDAHLTAVSDKPVGESTMRLMTQARFGLAQQQPQRALATLKTLRDAGVTGHVGVLQLELEAQRQTGNWDEVLEIVNHLRKLNALDDTSTGQIRQQAWAGRINSNAHETQSLTTVWKAVPGEIKRNAQVAAAAAQAYIKLGETRLARQILTDSLNAQWDSKLIMLYGECARKSVKEHSDVVAQIGQAERWLLQHPQDANLLLVLGQMCMHQELWSKAQSYLDASISITPGSPAYNALGQLAEKLQQPDQAFKYFRKSVMFDKRSKT